MARLSKKLQILQVLTAHLQGITAANGYDYDLSSSVFRGRTEFGPNDPLPAVSILEIPRPEVGDFSGTENLTHKEEWMLLVQGWIQDDKINPTDPAYGLGAAVQQRLSDLIATKKNGAIANPDIYRLNGLVTCLYIGPFTVRPPQAQVSSTAYFFLPLRVGVVTDVSQPFVPA